MQKQTAPSKNETLDPDNWEAMRTLGHRMVDDMLSYLQTVRERPAWQRPDRWATGKLDQPVPERSTPSEEIYEEFLQEVLPYNLNNVHPRFWAWVQGGGTPLGMLADMLASGMNSNTAIGDHSAMYVEKQVLDWAKEMMGFPETAGGLLVSGGSMANITALIAARNHLYKNVRGQGMAAIPGQLVVYGSAETHNCMIKGVEAIGIGRDFFRTIAVDDQYRIKTAELEKTIAADVSAGLIPFCIVGNAGTVNTGAIDPLTELAAIAKAAGCWFHIDGAFGAIPKILPEFSETLKGIELADSLAFDYHKWMYVNYEVACILIKDAAVHRAAFAVPASYLVSHERGVSSGPDPYSNYGLELSRGFKALKVWMSLKEHGLEKYRHLIRQNLRQAQYLAALIELEKELELVTVATLNIVCYRFNPGIADNEMLNTINKEITMQLQEKGIALPSYTMLNNKYVIRVAITNHRSTMEDFDLLVGESIRLGREISQNHSIT